MKINHSSNKQAGYSDDGAFAFLILLGLVALLFLAIGYNSGVKSHQKECVKAGVAHYEPDDSGESVFKFNVITNK